MSGGSGESADTPRAISRDRNHLCSSEYGSRCGDCVEFLLLVQEEKREENENARESLQKFPPAPQSPRSSWICAPVITSGLPVIRSQSANAFPSGP